MKKRLFALLGLLLVLRAANPAEPAYASVTLAWDLSPSPGVRAYRLYACDDGRTWRTALDMGVVDYCTVTNLRPGTTYVFAVSCFDAEAESPWSNTVTYTPYVGFSGRSNLRLNF